MFLSAAVAALLCVGCNQVASTTKKQSDALTAVVKADCDKWTTCGDIGAGKKYASRTDCETDSRGFWNNQWDVVDCDGKINGDNLSICTESITQATCGFDRSLTTFTRCSKSDVCNGK